MYLSKLVEAIAAILPARLDAHPFNLAATEHEGLIGIST